MIDITQRTHRFGSTLGRILLFLSLPFVFAKSGFSIEQCVQESLRFADCVDEAILTLSASSSSRDELAERVVKTCAEQKSHYEACGQFEKSAFSADFIKNRVELFTKEKFKAFAGIPASPDPATN